MSMGRQIISLRDIEEDDALWSPLSDISTGSCGSSSSFSWTDETEWSTTRELEEQFQKFEEALYLEGSPSGLPQSLQDEVKLWAEYSPHIRIRGKQVKLNKRSEIEEGIEECDASYEEVIAFHESLLENPDENLSLNTDLNDNYTSSGQQKVIGEDLKNELVNKLFDNEWPNILANVEPIIKSLSAGKSKTYIKDSDKLQTNPEATKSQKVLSRSNSSRSYLRDLSPRKPNVDYKSEYSCVLSSRGVRLHSDNFSNGPLSERELRVPHTSLPNTRVNRIITFSAKLPEHSRLDRSKPTPLISSKKSKRRHTSDKTVILPPIEALAITPKKPDKRANSAMVRFTKTLPRVRPNTSKKKNVSAKNLNTVTKQVKKPTNGNNTVEESVHHITLEVIGIKSNTTNRSNRWH